MPTSGGELLQLKRDAQKALAKLATVLQRDPIFERRNTCSKLSLNDLELAREALDERRERASPRAASGFVPARRRGVVRPDQNE